MRLGLLRRRRRMLTFNNEPPSVPNMKLADERPHVVGNGFVNVPRVTGGANWIVSACQSNVIAPDEPWRLSRKVNAWMPDNRRDDQSSDDALVVFLGRDALSAEVVIHTRAHIDIDPRVGNDGLSSRACGVVDNDSITSYPCPVDRSINVCNLDLIEER